eukprot:1060616-Lingulodinium_polyedra.AAC.1
MFVWSSPRAVPAPSLSRQRFEGAAPPLRGRRWAVPLPVWQAPEIYRRVVPVSPDPPLRDCS